MTREVLQFLNASSSNFDTNLCRVVYYDYVTGSPPARDGSRLCWARNLQAIHHPVPQPNHEHPVSDPRRGLERRRQPHHHYDPQHHPGLRWPAPERAAPRRHHGHLLLPGRRYLSHRHRHVRPARRHRDQHRGRHEDCHRKLPHRAICANLVYSIGSGPNNILLSSDTYSYTDNLNLSYIVTHLDGTTESVVYGCCGLDSTTDRDVVTTTYAYDRLKRQISSTRNGITTSNVLDAAGNVLVSIRIGSNGPPIITRQAAYDTAGRLPARPTPWAEAPSIRKAQTPAVRPSRPLPTPTTARASKPITRTAPCSRSPARRLSPCGTITALRATAASSGLHQGNQARCQRQRHLGMDQDLHRHARPRLQDRLCRRLAAPDRHHRLQQHRPDDQSGRSRRRREALSYNTKGELAYSVLDSNRNYQIDFTGADRITWTTNDVVSDQGTMSGAPAPTSGPPAAIHRRSFPRPNRPPTASKAGP